MELLEKKKPVNWQAMCRTAETWVSDLSFYKDDLNFLQNLIDSYFSEMVENTSLDEIREEIMGFQDIRHRNNVLLKEVKEHLRHLALCASEQEHQNGGDPIHLHEHFQQKLAKFNYDFRELKREIFGIVDMLLENREMENSPYHKWIS